MLYILNAEYVIHFKSEYVRYINVYVRQLNAVHVRSLNAGMLDIHAVYARDNNVVLLATGKFTVLLAAIIFHIPVYCITKKNCFYIKQLFIDYLQSLISFAFFTSNDIRLLKNEDKKKLTYGTLPGNGEYWDMFFVLQYA